MNNLNPVDIGKYFAYRFYADNNKAIEEMQIHKLLYFAQRESFILFDVPLFSEEFRGWKFGPVLGSVHTAFENGEFTAIRGCPPITNPAVTDVYNRLGQKSAWSLSDLSRAEYSWKQSRKGIEKYAVSDNPMKTEDIRVDAKRIKERRELLALLSGE